MTKKRRTKKKILKYPEMNACLQQGKDCRMTKKGDDREKENDEKDFILR